MCLGLRAHPSTVPILSSQPAKCTSSLPKVFLILLNMDEPQLGRTAWYTFNLSSGSNDGKCFLQSTAVCARAVHRNWENSPALPLSFPSVTCRLYLFIFFATIIKQVRRLKSARVTFDLNLTPHIFFFPSTRLLTAADQAAGQDLNPVQNGSSSGSSHSASLAM